MSGLISRILERGETAESQSCVNRQTMRESSCVNHLWLGGFLLSDECETIWACFDSIAALLKSPLCCCILAKSICLAELVSSVFRRTANKHCEMEWVQFLLLSLWITITIWAFITCFSFGAVADKCTRQFNILSVSEWYIY